MTTPPDSTPFQLQVEAALDAAISRYERNDGELCDGEPMVARDFFLAGVQAGLALACTVINDVKI